jgi:hypothetical protein
MGRRATIDAAAWIWALAAKYANRAVFAQGVTKFGQALKDEKPHCNDLVRDCVTVRRTLPRQPGCVSVFVSGSCRCQRRGLPESSGGLCCSGRR